ncbi:MAG: winged helix-turn-helix domain-containing protein [Erythrobacter sp.]|uniref:winged helix-turn-helix domain-containing protein n=1 Tax=Erythrobacter sp. TaxID=1042 RepID=UPI002600072E|nr:winged helix-turn-helix domain-containing protein [Erythrobacter sp.]MCL9998748.1 winged helix-turn-helix domain-containing protein [Erythrobacter sp.]
MNVAPLRRMDSIQLGHERRFVLGGLSIDPPSRRVSRGGKIEDLEPRVMQVLVALAQAEGNVVSRDELFNRCWDGRIVGEHAINRVIARLRKLENEFEGAFRIETVTKVGYRLVVTGSASERAPDLSPPAVATPGGKSGLSRRTLLAAGAIAVAGAAGLGVYALGSRRQTNEAALAFYRKGIEAQRQGLAEQNEQAVAHFRKAVDADPLFADGWGALALSYRHLLEMRPTGEEAALAQSARSAAMRALELDPRNADAETALILIPPIYGNWAKIERDCRAALQRHPDAWLLHGNIGNVALETGRSRAAVAHFEHAIAIDQFLPISWAKRADALWSAGRIEEADRSLSDAFERWPRHPRIWFARCQFLTFAGRPDEALLMIANQKAHPFGVPASAIEDALLVAKAAGSAGAAETRAALERTRSGSVAQFVWLCCAAGQLTTALQRLDDYFTIPMNTAAPKLARRYTAFLFSPPAKPLWHLAEFSRLTERIGLGQYWESTGRAPDHLLMDRSS